MLPLPLENLMPQPLSFRPTEGQWTWDGHAPLPVVGPAESLAVCLGLLGPDFVCAAQEGQQAAIELAPGQADGEAYGIQISSTQLRVECSATSPHAAFATLQQLLRIARTRDLPAGLIEDSPAIPTRGFMLDVSRDRVPKMQQLHELIRTLWGLKYNHLELYLEHAFSYKGHDAVWRNASPLTQNEVRELDGACRFFGIELVANQNCLGHMHRWLTLPEYAHLSEDPRGMEHAFSVEREPFSLCPTDPKSLALATDLIDQLLACHQTPKINVGLDETFDLGEGKSAAACEQHGKGRVYLDYLHGVHQHIKTRGAQMLFWGDIIAQHPELVPDLPKDAIALLWGYEAGHPFDEQARLFAASGLEFWIVPGTSSWQCLLGRIDNARKNLREAAQAAVAHGAKGWLVADWGDFGHWQPWPISWPGLVLGAAEGWNPGHTSGDLAQQIELAIPEAKGHGAGLVALGESHQALASPAVNGTSPFFHLRYAHQSLPLERAPSLTLQGLEAFDRAKTQALALLPPGTPITQEFQAASAISGLGESLAKARLGAPDSQTLADLPKPVRSKLQSQWTQVLDLQAQAWSLRSRSGGCEDSLQRLRAIAALLI